MIKISQRDLIYTVAQALKDNRDVYQYNVSILKSGKVISHMADRPPKEPVAYTIPMKAYEIPPTFTAIMKAASIIRSKKISNDLSPIIELCDDFFVRVPKTQLIGEIAHGIENKGLLVLTSTGEVRGISYNELPDILAAGIILDFKFPLYILYNNPRQNFENEAVKFLYWLTGSEQDVARDFVFRVIPYDPPESEV